MPRFIKKPVVITAEYFDGSPAGIEKIRTFTGLPLDAPSLDGKEDGQHALIIPTLEGEHRASPGDWIIRGVQGEYYPCKPHIFIQTYDSIEAPE